jgi:hypothetical protein
MIIPAATGCLLLDSTENECGCIVDAEAWTREMDASHIR